jgi:hypothetical protein
MASPTSPNLAFAELAPHALHLAVISGRKIVAWHAFRPDAKSEIAAFVAEHKIAGLVRASLLGDRIHLHLSDASEASLRQPAALQAHLASLSIGFDGAPGGVVCDAASGRTPDPAGSGPWLLTAFDTAAFATLRETLGELGLAPVSFTVAAPAHIGAVASSLKGDETAAVIIPGTDEAWLAWVGAKGVQSVTSIPLGFTQIFEAVQKGLGLKFRAAAGKLFFNDTYDFTEASTKICELLVPAVKPALDARPATSLHIAGLAAGQAWFSSGLSSALGLGAWKATGSGIAAQLGLDAGGQEIPFGASGLLQLAASAGSSSAPWIQPTLETLAAEALSKPKTAAPIPVAKAAAPAPAAAAPAIAPAPAAPAAAPIKPVIKPAAPAAAIKPAAAPKPAPKPAVKPAPKAMPAPVLAVSVEDEQETPAATPTPVKRSKAPVFIAAGVGVVAAIVGLAAHFRSTPNPRTVQNPPSAEPAAATQTPASAQPSAPAPTPVPQQSTTPKIDPVPAPLPVKPPAPAPGAGSSDTLAAETRKFANSRYRLEIAEKGFIQSLATARDEILVESAGGISLQGSYIGTDGRRKWFNVGGVDDAGYVASVRKSVRDGFTVFDVTVQHPRFSLDQTFTCLPDSVKVIAKFTPVNLRDPRGAIAAVHSVRLAPVALNPSLRMRAQDNSFIYAMKPSTLRVQFDPVTWARDGAGGLQTIIAGENGVVFHFTENTEVARNTLNYEIQLGSTSN